MHLRKGMTLVEVLVILAIFLIIATLIGGCFMGSTSDGARVGHIQKLSHKGTFKKTWEGELAVEGVGRANADKRGQAGGSVWAFTVENTELIPKMQEAMDNDQKVKLSYKEYRFSSPLSGDTNYRVYDVKILKPNE